MDAEETLTVIIPAYNEEKHIVSLISCLIENKYRVLLVDDGSNDSTRITAGNAGAEVLSHAENRGKGASIISGIIWCLEKGFSPIVLMDADGQHPPESIPDFLKVFEKEKADLVLGNRMKNAADMPRVRWLTNKFMSWFQSLFLGLRLSDTQCGYRLLGRRAMELHRSIAFQCQRFDYESEILFYAVKKNLKICEVDIPALYVKDRKSRIHPVKDTLRWFKALFLIWRSTSKMK